MINLHNQQNLKHGEILWGGNIKNCINVFAKGLYLFVFSKNSKNSSSVASQEFAFLKMSGFYSRLLGASKIHTVLFPHAQEKSNNGHVSW